MNTTSNISCTNMKRLFIAFKIDKSYQLLEVFNDLKNELKDEKIKWVDPDHLHLTLDFLGDTDEKYIPEINHILDSVSPMHNKFNIILSSFGVFKSLHHPTVLWLGIEKNQVMVELKAELDVKLEAIGFKLEKREFNPHLTIGRPRFISGIEKLKHLIEKYKNKMIDTQSFSEIILFESILLPAGPLYKELHKSPLKNQT
jgi:RNA 2',3'-cyclic 3'-phosphodiesterase